MDENKEHCTVPEGNAVCIVDDDEAVLGVLMMIVGQLSLQVRGFLEPGKFLAEQTDEPACLIVDWHLKEADGMEVIATCQKRWPHTPMILISGQATVPVAVSAMRQGVICVLEKPVRAEDLKREVLEAIGQAKQGREAAAKLVAAQGLIQSLSDNERAVLELVVQGTSNKRIAAEMDLSMRTIEKYRAAVFEKLAVDSAAEATQIWVLAGAEDNRKPPT